MHSTSSPDLLLDLGTFAATSANVQAVTPAGRDFLAALFGAGAVGATLPKSRAAEFAAHAAANGMVVA